MTASLTISARQAFPPTFPPHCGTEGSLAQDLVHAGIAADHVPDIFARRLRAGLNDPAAPSDKQTALVPDFDQVAGIDKIVMQQFARAADMGPGRARRADVQPAILQLHLHRAPGADEAGGKTLAA